MTSIGVCAFEFCRSLTSISIPDGVTSIGEGAFGSCSNLTSISIPDGVTSIGVCAFYSCSSLTSVSIPDSVTSIGENSFGSCSSLTSISIPDGVTSIDSTAFTYCYSLRTIYTNANSYASQYGFGNAVVDTTTGYPAGSLIIAKTNAKTKLGQANSDLLRYIAAGGKSTESVYTEVKTAIGSYSTDAEIEAEIDANKLIKWTAKINTKISLLITASKGLELTNAKTTARTSLDNYKDATAYREAQKTELTAAINTGKTNIESAIVAADVTKALENAKAAIDAIKTDAQLTAEELIATKTTSKNSLDTYKDATLYREAQKTELTAAINTGKTNIESAIIAADVTKALENAKVAIDEIKTDAQLIAEEKLAEEKLAEELIAMKTTSKNSLDTYKDVTTYRGAQKIELTAAINTGKTNIDNAITAADVTKALDNAKIAIDAIKTDAQLTAEEKKNSEINKTGDVNALPLVVAAMIGMAGIASFGEKKIV